MPKRFVILLFLLFTSLGSRDAKGQTGEWLIYFGDWKFNEKWSLWHEAQARYTSMDFTLNKFLVRSAISYWHTNNESFSLGMGLVDNTYDIIEARGDEEFRLYQQYFKRIRYNSSTLSTRFRTEQRFFASGTQNRARLMLSGVYPLRSDLDHTLYLTAYNEIFVRDRGGWFDQNRAYAGLGYRFGGRRIELAYMIQSIEGYNNHQINIALFNNF